MTATARTIADFTGFEWGVGTIVGHRRWRLDHHGRLYALHARSAGQAPLASPQQAIWRPGENVARCEMSTFSMSGPAGLSFGSPLPPPPFKPHPVPSPDCGCGYWAYTNPDEAGPTDTNTVLGVIEGWGRTVVGMKGFRCEKARIVALHAPARERPKHWWQTWPPDPRCELFSLLYPDVALYESVDEMFAEHRLSASPLPSPDSDEFWTMP